MNREDYRRSRSNDTSAEVLHTLASSREESVVLGVAANLSTTSKTLALLSHHSLVEVRALVAHHPNTAVQTLQAMALKGDSLFYHSAPPGGYPESDSIYEHFMMRFS